MGIEMGMDEADKKRLQVQDEIKKIQRDHAGSPNAREAYMARWKRIDRTILENPDPNKNYRFVNREKKGRVTEAKGKGYTIVPTKSETRAAHGENVEGGQCVGDLVLMEIPVEKAEMRRAERYAILDEMYGGRIEATKENVNKIARDGGLAGPHKNIVTDESGNY